uniref:Myb/SANT-like domain-containing protein n=1 Tax=Populus trichocarpa TaxID=3694 RepID=A0A3N7EW31_POPTR
MKEYRNIANILSQNGCAWEETEQMEIAGDDDWYAYIKEHPGADRILDSYNDLCVLYGNSMAVGRASHKGVKMGFDKNEFDMGIDGVFGDAPYQNLKYLTKGRNESLFLPQWWCLQGKLADTGKERLKKHLVRNQW